MLYRVIIRIKRLFAVIHFGLLTLRYAGLRVTLQKLGHQLYGSTVFLYIVVDLDDSRPPARFPCRTMQATEMDIKMFFKQMQHESKDGKYQLLVRKWYHERGLGTPYVQKTLDTDEVCSIRWVVTAQDLEMAGLRDRFPVLKENELMYENAYTLEKFRGKGVQTSAQLRDLLKGMGLKRSINCVAEDNVPTLRFLNRREGKIFEKVLERHFLFHVTRKTLEAYDPPIPITLFEEK